MHELANSVLLPSNLVNMVANLAHKYTTPITAGGLPLVCFYIQNNYLYFFYLQATVMKKKMYYNMKVKTVHRQLAELRKIMTELKEKHLAIPKDRLQTLAYVIKQV